MTAHDDGQWFEWPRLSEATLARVVAMLRAGQTSFHLDTFEAFETAAARAFGVRHALACCNGTSAAYSAFRALGVGPGDVVIAPALTHWAAVLPAVQCGARVAFADLLPGTCHVDPDSVRRLIGGATRAVVVTATWGEPLRLTELRELCDEHGLALIEDASHAHGATFRGRPVGSFGDVSFCSLQAKKLVSGGEGGLLLTDREELYFRAMELGHSARLFRAPPAWRRLIDVGGGFKFRPSPILVALAHGSLEALPEQNEVRRRACGRLRQLLAGSGLFEGLERPAEGRTFFRCELLLAPRARREQRDAIVDELRAAGLRVDRKHYPFLPTHEATDGHRVGEGPWPVARDVLDRLFYVEAFTAYSEEVIGRYARSIVEVAGRALGGRA